MAGSSLYSASFCESSSAHSCNMARSHYGSSVRFAILYTLPYFTHFSYFTLPICHILHIFFFLLAHCAYCKMHINVQVITFVCCVFAVVFLEAISLKCGPKSLPMLSCVGVVRCGMFLFDGQVCTMLALHNGCI